MNSSEINKPSQANALNAEDYSRAMNFIGENLLSALTKAVEELPPSFRNRQLISQALSAFLTNIIYKQAPGNQEACQQMLDDISQLVKTQLNNISAIAL